MSPVRAFAAALLIVAAGVVAGARPATDERPDVPPLTIGIWRGVDQPPLDAETERVLAADSYVNREYSAPGHAGVGLYVAYYAQQRPSASIHSPLHCLPGTGWEASDVATLTIERPDGTLGTARRMIVRKHLDQALVLYWYAIHGRMLANEFASKAWLIHDGLALGRSDASLVRIVVPITASAEVAEREGLAFARAFIASHP